MKKSGFTLVEMLVTIAIMAIVLFIGVPSFNSIIRSSDMSANSSDLISALNYARMEAVKRGDSIKLELQIADDWLSEMVVSVDDSAEELRIWGEFNSESTLVSKNDLTSFVFNASGEVDNGDELTLCYDSSGETGRIIHILASGAAFAEKKTCE